MKPLPGRVLNSGAATFEPVSDSQRPMLGLASVLPAWNGPMRPILT